MRNLLFGRTALLLPVFLLLFGVFAMGAQSPTAMNLMPMPAKLQAGSGFLKIDETFRLFLAGYQEPRLERASQRFLEQLHRQTSLVLQSRETADPAKAILQITTDHESKAIQEVGEDESYALDVTASGAKLHAANPLGVLRGLQTFLQLVTVTPDGFGVPVVNIQDQPRFPWRGLMIDSGRHFTPLAVLELNLDGMEAVKLNVFHWHLSENQGFRVESHKYPKLHEMGSDGLFYTQDEIRGLIAYARDRGIRVVPEFDMPGHSTAWFVGHPELASGPGPYQIERRWGIFDPAMDPTSEKTYKFLNDFIAEMAKLFPDAFFHIGGDEVNGKEWDANAAIQEFKKAHGIKDNNGLQAYFSQRVQDLVVKHGKIPVGWDEILVPGAPKSIVIHSWRGPESLAAAAKQGYRTILSNGYYIDLGWSAARHYAVEPLSGEAANLTPEQQKLVLGGEATMWSEYVNAENIDSRIWPRTAAIAERFWSPADVRDPASMYARLPFISERLEWVGLTHRTYQRKMIDRMAGAATPEQFAALTSLVEALEPVKDYSREGTGPEPTSQTPLDHLVDAVHPESAASRLFSGKVDAYLASSCKDAATSAELRAQLLQWAGNDARLQPLEESSFLVKQASPASSAFSQAAEIALGALERISQGVPFTPELQKQQADSLNALELQAHKAQVTIPALPAFQKLLDAATGGGGCAGAR